MTELPFEASVRDAWYNLPEETQVMSRAALVDAVKTAGEWWGGVNKGWNGRPLALLSKDLPRRKRNMPILPLLPMALGVDHDVIVQCFAVVVIGGFGSMLGTFVASIIVGVVYSFSILFWPDGALAMIFLIVIVVLIWRPWGLFGTELRY